MQHDLGIDGERAEINVRRIYEGRVIYEGPAAWRTVRFDAEPPHSLDGDVFAPAEDVTGWMYPVQHRRFDGAFADGMGNPGDQLVGCSPTATSWLPVDGGPRET